MNTNLFKVIYFVGIGAEAALRFPHERQRKRVQVKDRRVTAVEQVLLGWLTLAMGVLPLIYSLTSWLDFADYRLSPGARARLGWAGAALLAASAWLFGRAHRDLGANWSPSLEIGEQQTLTTRGVYGVIRHPMYASQLLWGLAQALLLPNWVAGLGGLLAFLPMYLVRVPREEQMMRDHFGADYRAYCARTGRIVPQLHRVLALLRTSSS